MAADLPSDEPAPDFSQSGLPVVSWQPAPLPAPLPPGEVHVWQLEIGDRPATDLADSCLSSDESARAARFHFPADRHRFVARRAALRSLLAGYLGTTAADVRFVVGPRGRPLVDLPPTWPALHFSVTSSGARALFAFARTPTIGIDLEQVRAVPEWEGIARAHFSPAEARCLARASVEARTRTFLAIWTRKEAHLKAFSLGLIDDLATIDTLANDPATALSPRQVGAHAAAALTTFVPDQDSVASLCWGSGTSIIRRWRAEVPWAVA